MGAPLPAVEVAHHAHPHSVRRPDGEVHAGSPAVRDEPGPEGVVGAIVGALGEEVRVELAEEWPEAVRVIDLLGRAADGGDLEPVVGHGACRQHELEDPGRMHRAHGLTDASRPLDEGHARSARAERPHCQAVLGAVGPQHAEGVGVAAGNESVEFGGREGGRRSHDDRPIVAWRPTPTSRDMIAG